MEVWFAIPSANFARATKCFAAWKAMGYKTAVLIDKGKPAPGNVDLVLEADPWPGYCKSFIRLCQAIGDADIIVTGGDDITPDFKKKAEEIAEECFEKYPDGFFVMQPTGDDMGTRYKICASPWVGKGWIKRAYQGKGPVWPGYTVFYGDEELKDVSSLRGVLWQRGDLLQFHDHYSRPDGPKKLDYQVKNDQYWIQDGILFNSRKAAGFPGHEPIGDFDKHAQEEVKAS